MHIPLVQVRCIYLGYDDINIIFLDLARALSVQYFKLILYNLHIELDMINHRLDALYFVQY